MVLCIVDFAVHLLCAGFEMSLYGGKALREGMLLVRYTDRYPWGTVCADGWGQVETDVVCKQLGYSSGKHLADVHEDHFEQLPGTGKELGPMYS